MRLRYFIFIFAFLFFANVAFAQICDPNATALCNPTHAADFTVFIKNNIFTFIASVLGIVAIGMIVYSGIRMVVSQGNEEELSKAKSSLQWTITGFIVIILAYVIISAISNFIGVGTNSNQALNPITSNNLIDLSTKIFKGLEGLAAILAITFIIISGFRYITARGNEEQTESAKRSLQWAIIGLVIIVLAYVIVAATLSLFGHNLGSTNSSVR